MPILLLKSQMAPTAYLKSYLRLISAAVVSIDPVVPNPYTLLSLISPSTIYFTVLDLKDGFFTIPLHPDPQDLFAFTWTDPNSHRSQQLTWTVLPQAFMIVFISLAKLGLRLNLSQSCPKLYPPIRK